MGDVDEIETGQSRRDLLKKAAVVGAVAWTVPMVISSPAFAASAKCTGSQRCTNFYGNSIGTPSGGGAASSIGPAGTGQCTTRNISNLLCPGVTYPNGTALQLGSATSNAPSTGYGSFSITLPANSVPIALDIHFGGQPANGYSACTYYVWNGSNFVIDPNGNAVDGGLTYDRCSPVVTTSGTISGGLTITVSKTATWNCGGFSGSNIYYCK